MESNDNFKNSKRKKLLWLFPLIIMPFATLLFWAMGGGNNTKSTGTIPKGFNSKLPAAKNDDDAALDKLNYYDRAAIDSSKVNELRRKDPNYKFDSTAIAFDSLPVNIKGRLITNSMQSPQEKRVYEKLEALQRAVSAPPSTKMKTEENIDAPPYTLPPGNIGALQQMMESMGPSSASDPELEQIGGMLENILDIQYPERMQQKLKDESNRNKGKVYTVATGLENNIISTIEANEPLVNAYGRPAGRSGFFSLVEEDPGSLLPQDNTVAALIAETQTVVNGSTVKMALTQDIYINGQAIPKGTFVVGTASLKGERLAIEIQTIRHGNSIYPVELQVYDLDGLDGIYIPGAINREVAKASADRSMQSLGVTTLSDSWGAQATGAGIEAAKGLFSRKVKLVKVTLKKGYRILLRDEKQDK